MMRYSTSDPSNYPANIEEIPTHDTDEPPMSPYSNYESPSGSMGGYQGNFNVKYTTATGNIDLHVRPSVYKVEFPRMPRNMREKHDIYYIPDPKDRYAAETCLRQQSQMYASRQDDVYPVHDDQPSPRDETYPDTNMPSNRTLTSYIESFTDAESLAYQDADAYVSGDVSPKLADLWSKVQSDGTDFTDCDMDALANAVQHTEHEISTALVNDLEDLQTQRLTESSERCTNNNTTKRSNPFQHRGDEIYSRRTSIRSYGSKNYSNASHTNLPDCYIFPNDVSMEMFADKSMKRVPDKRINWMKLKMDIEDEEIYEVNDDDSDDDVDNSNVNDSDVDDDSVDQELDIEL